MSEIQIAKEVQLGCFVISLLIEKGHYSRGTVTVFANRQFRPLVVLCVLVSFLCFSVRVCKVPRVCRSLIELIKRFVKF
jgi:hypothetical protein